MRTLRDGLENGVDQQLVHEADASQEGDFLKVYESLCGSTESAAAAHALMICAPHRVSRGALPPHGGKFDVSNNPDRNAIQRQFPAPAPFPSLRRSSPASDRSVTCPEALRARYSRVSANLTSTCPRSSMSLRRYTVRSGRRLISTACEPSERRLTRSFTVMHLAAENRS
jgi:hypothetical protein